MGVCALLTPPSFPAAPLSSTQTQLLTGPQAGQGEQAAVQPRWLQTPGPEGHRDTGTAGRDQSVLGGL